jgi:hypothetical protein
MNRFYSRDTMTLDPEHGQFVHYEDAHAIEVDRDTKAANLDTLRKLVLQFSTAYEDRDGEYIYTQNCAPEYSAAVDFARGLPE